MVMFLLVTLAHSKLTIISKFNDRKLLESINDIQVCKTKCLIMIDLKSKLRLF